MRSEGPAGRAPAEQRVLAYLLSELVEPGAELSPDLDLLSSGLLDSMGVLRLASFVGEEFEIEIQPADFVIENFRSAAAVAEFVRRSQARMKPADAPDAR